MSHVPLVPIGAPRSAFLSDADYAANLEAMREREALLRERRDEVAAGWGQTGGPSGIRRTGEGSIYFLFGLMDE